MNNVILIDDNPEFVRSFTNDAKINDIHVVAGRSLSSLKTLAPMVAYKSAAVLLDVKGLLDDEQVLDSAGFIGSALTYLDSTIPHFPRFILSHDEKELNALKVFHPNEKVFVKLIQDELDKLFDELTLCIENAEPLRIKRENMEVFDAFDKGLLPPNLEALLLSIIKNYNENDPTNFRGIIGEIREFHEEIYRSLNQRNKDVVPDRFINRNGSPTFTGEFHKYLCGNPGRENNYQPSTTVYQDNTISLHSKSIHNACSEYLHGSSRTGYEISSYTIKSLINSLLEVIIWSKQY